MTGFLDKLKFGPVIFDGAMGTMIQAKGLEKKDFGGHPDVNEILNVTRPDIISSIHHAYLEAGADIVKTNTFGASRVVLAEEGLEDRIIEINLAAAKIARDAVEKASKMDGAARFVAGELGPTSKLPSLGHITFSEMEAAYLEQATALIEGGVDLILTATVQDPLQAKAAASAARAAMKKLGRELPLIISVTIEKNGTMLIGTSLSAVLAAVAPYDPAAFGLNCALGPDLMEEYLAELAQVSPFPLICQPNAGLPENLEGRAVYPLGPKDFAAKLGSFVKKYGIAIVGGCCGTTPEHIKRLNSVISEQRTVNRKKRKIDVTGYGSQVTGHGSIASLYNSVSIDQEPKPFLIAEQTNANGSKKFRRMVEAKNWDACVALAKDAANGAHALDVCLALPGKDEVQSMHELIPRLVKSVDRPLMIDSTSPDAIEAALSHIGGRAIINSINLEDGGTKAKSIIKLAKRFGAMLVCLTIDEKGMATTSDGKFEIAKRLVKLAADGGLHPRDLFIDSLTFTLGSGDPSTANAAVETLKAIRLIKAEFPDAAALLGVSNVSFGLPPGTRRALTSLFLERAIKMGLDAAIVNPRTITPIDRIDPKISAIVERLIDNDKSQGDPLKEILTLADSEASTETLEISHEEVSACDKLARKILDADKNDLETAIKSALKEKPAQEIINDVLLQAMKTVGERFGSGKLPLPFVLGSAETMRAAVDLISPHLAKGTETSRGTIVLATVRGDVHDIGKNLVDAILSNNGFRVINLGIRQAASNVIEAARAHNADAIGLSGLLVSSTEIMREDLETFHSQGIDIPVLCGGAALTAKFTNEILAPAYGEKVHYCADAFEGLKAMEQICDERRKTELIG